MSQKVYGMLFLPFIIMIISMIVMLGFVRVAANNIHKHSSFFFFGGWLMIIMLMC